jgi:hypothetical protein
MRSSLRPSLAIVAVVGLVLVGCGSPTNKAQVVGVTGQVLLDGKPLEFGSVSFQPIQGGQPARGDIDSEGKFVLSTYKEGDGAAVGRHRVKVAYYAKQDPAMAEQQAGDSLGDSLIPERYTSFAMSGIEVSVLAQGNAPFVFELKSDTPAEDADGESEAASASEEAADAEDASGETSEEGSDDGNPE